MALPEARQSASSHHLHLPAGLSLPPYGVQGVCLLRTMSTLANGVRGTYPARTICSELSSTIDPWRHSRSELSIPTRSLAPCRSSEGGFQKLPSLNARGLKLKIEFRCRSCSSRCRVARYLKSLIAIEVDGRHPAVYCALELVLESRRLVCAHRT